jgi:hypothetical protein
MTMALKTEWIICSENTDIELQVSALERNCVGKVRIIKGDFEPESVMKMTTKLEFEVFAETDMDEFWDLVDGAIDEESEE